MGIDLWTKDEIQALKENRFPETRSKRAARTKAFKLGLSFCPDGKPECRNLNLTESQKDEIIDFVKRKRNRTLAAQHFGVSRNYVVELCKNRGLEMAKRPHERLGEHVEYDGHNWSWKKGSWVCTSSKVRKTKECVLTKVIWKKHYGEYPGPEYDIRFKDGDRYNLDIDNLMKVTKSEAQKIRLQDPLTKALATASGIMGLLQVKINEAIDPSRKAERCAKAAKTRQERHPDLQKKMWETRRRNAAERGFYYSPETRRKMSESRRRYVECQRQTTSQGQ